jgi:inosine-uridine nucleoside N-ribohydrolase
VGIGVQKDDKPGRQSAWVGDYNLSKYPGKVHEDGVAAIIDTIRAADEPMTLVAIGPVPNIAEVVRRAPDVARKARFVGMHGSVRRGYGGSPEISAEWNVKADPQALQQVFAADWDITVTPLDTCGLVHLTGEKFQRVYRSDDPLVKALMANYQAWREAQEKKKLDPPDRSSTLFDTVAVWLGLSQRLLKMETIKLRVTDDGFTRIDDAGRPVHCAMEWNTLPDFEDELVRRLTAG